ncbi:uncharacterized protein I206_101038 [Kwoniella pini CBS 10737]|uniref:Uncharacterized protein n=1 Tax=Kwoniella pini CBS 10737 TaxID=1296096 RepID=A0A1B9IC37_9TREE|nr:uncharacterized protein I206_00288 [Kwoniella pini CBS 10737]OCF52987.1 hypothetical protein I206_00288 [Kwoniella pini CBS 10737]
MSTSTSSLLPILAVGGIWYYLQSRGSTINTIWLLLNGLDTLRALRSVRSNGRRVGLKTRKKAMRDSLLCWIIYVAVQTVGPVFSTCLSWIPFYSPIKAVICMGFLALRVPASSHIFNHFLVPTIKPYETPIDLSVLLIQSIGVLVFHYTLQVPILLIVRIALFSWTSIKSIIHFNSLSPGWSQTSPVQRKETPSTNENRMRASFLSPPPHIPGSILLRHPSPKPLTPRRSISFISPPKTPNILPPSPPSSDDEIQIIAGPSTPRRPSQKSFLHVEQVREIRRSPRRSKPVAQRNRNEEIVSLDLMNTRRVPVIFPINPGRVGVRDMEKNQPKGKEKAVPVLIIPDEEKEANIPSRSRVTKAESNTRKDVKVLSTSSESAPSQGSNRITSHSKLLARPNYTLPTDSKLKTNSEDASSRMPKSQSAASIVSSRSAQTKINQTVSKKSNDNTIKRDTLPIVKSSKPKTPRKPRVLKASLGGVAQDKTITRTAITARSSSRIKDIRSGQAEREDDKKVGEKRRTVESGVPARKRFKK